MADRDSARNSKDTNPDPITGAPGSHPVGTGVGAAGGGAAGAAIGSAVGPVGTAVGAVVGAVAGGLAGKGVAEAVDPTAEDAYWRQNYKSRPYVERGSDYNAYAPAYRYGWEARQRHAGKNFDEIETDLRSGWERQHGSSGMSWDRAKMAIRDSWERLAGRDRTSAGARQMNEGQTSIPVVEEELRVGKREVERGGVRVRTGIEERPVEEQVRLREEHVNVERRPVDRPATEADIRRAAQPGTIEVRERAEEPVVQKQARVVEEVVVGKDVEQRTETVRDSVRRTDVEIEETPGHFTPPPDQQHTQRPPAGA
jgi:uncharacterized protein (TIGR02271 family)